MTIGLAEVLATIALGAALFTALLLFVRTSRLRDTVYSDKLHRVELDRTRQAFEAELSRLHDQIYRDRGRWEELNHLVVDSIKERPATETSERQDSGAGWRAFVRSMGVDPDIPIEPRLVFVLTPLNSEEQGTYEAIRMVCQNVGLNVRRGDEVKITGPILPHIIMEILRASLIVANINGRNPNVFYELGIAQALGKPCILVAHTSEAIPFDLSTQQLVLYLNDAELRDRLSKALSQLAFGGHMAVVPRAYYSVSRVQEAMVILKRPEDAPGAISILRGMPGFIAASHAPNFSGLFVRGQSDSKQFITDVSEYLRDRGILVGGATLLSSPED